MTYNQYYACPSHCCPIHGCKYGLTACPVYRRGVTPEESDNNGCERCEADREELAYLELQLGEPIRPVSEYCNALRQYADALRQCAEEGKAGPFGSAEKCQEMADALFYLSFGVSKSNLLLRLIYYREDLRTRKCPTHDGRWSGLAFAGDECECECVGKDGSITGWLPNE